MEIKDKVGRGVYEPPLEEAKRGGEGEGEGERKAERKGERETSCERSIIDCLWYPAELYVLYPGINLQTRCVP